MSKITGSEVRGLMEAYGAVYTPQQLTEEQIWEEVETWVNSLIEEGYDLSDYTWEEMYEAYITEMGQTRTTGQSTAPSSSNRDRIKQSAVAMGTGQYGKYAPPEMQQKTPAPAPARPAARTPAAPARTPGGAPRPAAAPAARPAGGAPGAAKPAPSAPAANSSSASATNQQKIDSGTKVYDAQRKAGDFKGATETGRNVNALKYGANFAKPKTRNPLMDKTFGYQTGNAPDQQRSRASAIIDSGKVAALKPATPTAAIKAAPSTSAAASGSVTAPTAKIAAAPKPTPVAPKATPLGSRKPGSRFEHLDLFDIVKGHLLDEGYADTEEAAEAIMASMSEEWRAGIISELVVLGHDGLTSYTNRSPGSTPPQTPPQKPSQPAKPTAKPAAKLTTGGGASMRP